MGEGNQGVMVGSRRGVRQEGREYEFERARWKSRRRFSHHKTQHHGGTDLLGDERFTPAVLMVGLVKEGVLGRDQGCRVEHSTSVFSLLSALACRSFHLLVRAGSRFCANITGHTSNCMQEYSWNRTIAEK